ncbi:MAG: DUF4416 family protein [Candidatus Omnitrophica bacterium]|nr:DUF4416 family protein [Candidatus Omnitrophota bacterium]
MGRVKKHPPVKLIIGFIFKEAALLKKALASLERHFGKIDFESQILDFTHTDYYEKELGPSLKRKFISFKKLIPPENLPKIKIIANRIEDKLAGGANRTINIDPGYLNHSKLLLASTKDYGHRIYLNNGIFAEVTLFYQDKTFKTLDWTYPDYKTPEYIEIFIKIRDIYAQQIKA